MSICKTLIEKYNFDIHRTDKRAWTALHFSLEHGSYELVTFLVNKGADIYLVTDDGANCLHIAAGNEHLSICKTLIDQYDFDLHETYINGFTALHASALHGGYALVKFLIDKRADIHHTTKNGQNCLHIAAKNGYFSLCKTLVEKYNFDLHASDDTGFTQLHSLVHGGSYELVKFFLDMETDIHVVTNNGDNCLHIPQVCLILIFVRNLSVNAILYI